MIYLSLRGIYAESSTRVLKVILEEAERGLKEAKDRAGVNVVCFGTTKINKEQISRLREAESDSYRRYQVCDPLEPAPN